MLSDDFVRLLTRFPHTYRRALRLPVTTKPDQ
jgi:hypothetical protein